MKTNNRKLIGLSLHRCVCAVANGEVSFHDVVKIYTTTALKSSRKWKHILRTEHLYDDLMLLTFFKLLLAGKIVQSRLTIGKIPAWPLTRIWVNDKREIKWFRPRS